MARKPHGPPRKPVAPPRRSRRGWLIPAAIVAAFTAAAVYLLGIRPAVRTLNFEITPSQNRI